MACTLTSGCSFSNRCASVVNDSTPKQLYMNKGDGTFEEVGYQSGIALNENGREQAGMGVAVGDYDNDGLIDFYITNFSDDSNTLYHNDGEGNFTDVTFQAGLGEPTICWLPPIEVDRPSPFDLVEQRRARARVRLGRGDHGTHTRGERLEIRLRH